MSMKDIKVHGEIQMDKISKPNLYFVARNELCNRLHPRFETHSLSTTKFYAQHHEYWNITFKIQNKMHQQTKGLTCHHGLIQLNVARNLEHLRDIALYHYRSHHHNASEQRGLVFSPLINTKRNIKKRNIKKRRKDIK